MWSVEVIRFGLLTTKFRQFSEILEFSNCNLNIVSCKIFVTLTRYPTLFIGNNDFISCGWILTDLLSYITFQIHQNIIHLELYLLLMLWIPDITWKSKYFYLNKTIFEEKWTYTVIPPDSSNNIHVTVLQLISTPKLIK